MNKIILTLTCLLVVFSVSSHAELTNYYEKQAKDQTTINLKQIAQADFQTEILNVDSHITNK